MYIFAPASPLHTMLEVPSLPDVLNDGLPEAVGRAYHGVHKPWLRVAMPGARHELARDGTSRLFQRFLESVGGLRLAHKVIPAVHDADGVLGGVM